MQGNLQRDGAFFASIPFCGARGSNGFIAASRTRKRRALLSIEGEPNHGG